MVYVTDERRGHARCTYNSVAYARSCSFARFPTAEATLWIGRSTYTRSDLNAERPANDVRSPTIIGKKKTVDIAQDKKKKISLKWWQICRNFNKYYTYVQSRTQKTGKGAKCSRTPSIFWGVKYNILGFVLYINTFYLIIYMVCNMYCSKKLYTFLPKLVFVSIMLNIHGYSIRILNIFYCNSKLWWFFYFHPPPPHHHVCSQQRMYELYGFISIVRKLLNKRIQLV